MAIVTPHPPPPVSITKPLVKLTDEQSRILASITAWFDDPFSSKEFRLGGLAGTGKTTLMSAVPRNIRGSIQFCAPTGRAASVLRRKGLSNTRTIHSLLYMPESYTDHDEDCTCRAHASTRTAVTLSGEEYEVCVPGPTEDISCLRVLCTCPNKTNWIKKSDHICGMDCYDGCRVQADTGDLIVADEASMVHPDQYDDLMEIAKKVLWVGDHGQLPPVGCKVPVVMAQRLLNAELRTILRQTGQEGAAIINLAHAVRTQGLAGIRTVKPTPEITVKQMAMSKVNLAYVPGRMILCWKNQTRVLHNNRIRKQRKFEPGTLVTSDRVVCLRNIQGEDPITKTKGLIAANGQTGTVLTVEDLPPTARYHDLLWKVTVQMDDDDPGITKAFNMVRGQFGNLKTLNDVYGDLFDYGYVLTCHKAQGSEADEVVVLAESAHFAGEDHGARDPRWLYTSVTRAKKKLTVVVP